MIETAIERTPRPSDRIQPARVHDGLVFLLEDPASRDELDRVLKLLKKRWEPVRGELSKRQGFLTRSQRRRRKVAIARRRARRLARAQGRDEGRAESALHQGPEAPRIAAGSDTVLQLQRAS